MYETADNQLHECTKAFAAGLKQRETDVHKMMWR